MFLSARFFRVFFIRIFRLLYHSVCLGCFVHSKKTHCDSWNNWSSFSLLETVPLWVGNPFWCDFRKKMKLSSRKSVVFFATPAANKLSQLKISKTEENNLNLFKQANSGQHPWVDLQHQGHSLRRLKCYDKFLLLYKQFFLSFLKDDFSPILKLRETKMKVNPIFLPSLHHLAKSEHTLHETLRTLRSSEWPNFVLHSRNLGVVKKVLEVVRNFIIIIITICCLLYFVCLCK